MKRIVFFASIAVALAAGIAAGAYEGSRYGYDTGKAQGVEQGKAQGIEQGKKKVSDYVVNVCESPNNAKLQMEGKEYYCLTENQLVDLIQVISEKAIEEFRKQDGKYHGKEKSIPGI
jgi:flagellar biosynthesis/type III secretory pathway protein FliH